MEFEPTGSSDVSEDCNCVCEKCAFVRDALALHPGGFKRLESALNDADLERVITGGGDLPDAIRRAIVSLAGWLKKDGT